MRGFPANEACYWGRQKFPFKLHKMLTVLDESGDDDIIGWDASGLSFRVKQPKKIVEVLNAFKFQQTKIKSFQRQLNIYDFKRITKGELKGSYFHKNFVKSKPSMCETIQRKLQASEKVTTSPRPSTVLLAKTHAVKVSPSKELVRRVSSDQIDMNKLCAPDLSNAPSSSSKPLCMMDSMNEKMKIESMLPSNMLYESPTMVCSSSAVLTCTGSPENQQTAVVSPQKEKTTIQQEIFPDSAYCFDLSAMDVESAILGLDILSTDGDVSVHSWDIVETGKMENAFDSFDRNISATSI